MVFLLGFIIGKFKALDLKTLSFLAINVLYPLLVFYTFYQNPIGIEHITVFIIFLTLIISMIVIISLYAMTFKISRQKKYAMFLTGIFMNAGNFGIPLVVLVFNEDIMTYALMVMVVMSVFMNSLGLYFATSGANSSVTMKQSLLKVFKMPMLIAMVLGMLTQVLNITLTDPILNIIAMLSDSAIPLVMIILGLQLAKITFRNVDYLSVSFIVLLRLVISPLIVISLLTFINLDPTLAIVVIVLAAMPSAVNTTIFSIEYKVAPDFSSAVTFFSTVGSIITLPIWLSILL